MPKNPQINGSNAEFELLKQSIEYIKKGIEELKTDFEKKEEKAERNYVSKIEFEPVRKLVYGVVGLILVAVITGIIGLVVIK